MPEKPAGIAHLDHSHWESRLGALAAKHEVIGAQLGIRSMTGGEVAETVVAAAGSLNLNTGAVATASSLFDIGSITKVWTTVLLLQLADDGAFGLDDPVVSILPGFALADPDATAQVTVRQLLFHASGIDGDLFRDTGRGDDAVERYVDGLADAPIVHPVGQGFSYCNSGFVVAGRIIERLRGMSWDDALRIHLVEPLGLENTVTTAEQAILHGASIGHEPDARGTPIPAATWGIIRGMGPAGSIVSSVHDQLVFATAMLRGGLAENGSRILSEANAALMRAPAVSLTDRSHQFAGWGLGWFLEKWGTETVFGHDGITIGQHAFLRVLPDTGLIVCLLTNTGCRGDLLYDELIAELSAEWDTAAPAPLQPTEGFRPSVEQLSQYLGDYSTSALDLRIRLDGEELHAESIEKLNLDPSAPPGEPQRLSLHPISIGRFATQESPFGRFADVTFFEAAGGDYVSFGLRTLPKQP